MRDTEVSVDREYDIFEVFSDGALIWRNRIYGREAAMIKLTELAAGTWNEIYAVHVRSKEIIGRLNIKPQLAS